MLKIQFIENEMIFLRKTNFIEFLTKIEFIKNWKIEFSTKSEKYSKI
jgi:hypothetical protein